MHADEELIQACCDDLRERSLRGVQSSRAWDLLHGLVDEYRLACELSRGPDKKRADHWHVQAKTFERRLRRRMDYCGVIA